MCFVTLCSEIISLYYALKMIWTQVVTPPVSELRHRQNISTVFGLNSFKEKTEQSQKKVAYFSSSLRKALEI
jgi:hypothetical protein